MLATELLKEKFLLKMAVKLIQTKFGYSEKYYNGFYFVGTNETGFEDDCFFDVFYHPEKKHIMVGTIDTWGKAIAAIYMDFIPKSLCKEVLKNIQNVDSTLKNKKAIQKIFSTIPHKRLEEDRVFFKKNYREQAIELGMCEFTSKLQDIWREAFPQIKEIEKFARVNFSENYIEIETPV